MRAKRSEVKLESCGFRQTNDDDAKYSVRESLKPSALALRHYAIMHSCGPTRAERYCRLRNEIGAHTLRFSSSVDILFQRRRQRAPALTTVSISIMIGVLERKKRTFNRMELN